jgi:hypothetical protein
MIQLLTGNETKENLLKSVDAWKAETLGRKLFERGNAGRPIKTEGKNGIKKG